MRGYPAKGAHKGRGENIPFPRHLRIDHGKRESRCCTAPEILEEPCHIRIGHLSKILVEIADSHEIPGHGQTNKDVYHPLQFRCGIGRGNRNGDYELPDLFALQHLHSRLPSW